MYVPKHFALHELVPRHVFTERGEFSWELLDPRALRTLDALRSRFGSITVNNWRWGGSREWSGLRTELSPCGTQYSQHRFGRAFDCIFADISAEEVREFIRANPEIYPEICSIELDTSWLHFDVRNCDPIKTYSP
jgi:hypothetical protein